MASEASRLEALSACAQTSDVTLGLLWPSILETVVRSTPLDRARHRSQSTQWGEVVPVGNLGHITRELIAEIRDHIETDATEMTVNRDMGSGSVSQRADNRWQGVLRWKDEAGKSKRSWVYGKTRAAATAVYGAAGLWPSVAIVSSAGATPGTAIVTSRAAIVIEASDVAWMVQTRPALFGQDVAALR